MILTSLELCGFKSFARRLELCLNPGITVIVGPNGCGKSNIVDAIRWVTGEQNIRTLRGELKEDVIFKGSRLLPPTGMAEVSLTIANTDGILPVDYDEVLITRRIFQSGDSEYYINKKPCRLKDIAGLFLDTGAGINSYSTIDFGMVEGILSTNDQERRSFFEQAAGIIKYKVRRKETESKLCSVEQDLVRVEDILGEVGDKLRSLRIQVRRTKRYEKLSSWIKEIEIYLAAKRIDRIYESLQQMEAVQQDLQGKKVELLTRMHELEAEEERAQLDKISVEKSINESRRFFQQSRETVQKLEEQIRQDEDEVHYRLESKNAFVSELSDIAKELEQSRKKHATISEELTSSAGEMETLSTELEVAQAGCDASARALEIIGDRVKQKTDALATLQTEENRHGEEYIRLATEKEYLSKNLASMRKECSHGEDAAKKNRTVRKTAARELSELEGISTSLSGDITALESESQKKENELSKLRTLRANRETDFQNTKTTLKVFKDLARRNEGFSQATQRILNDGKVFPNLTKSVAENIHIQAEYETALEAILGEHLESILFRDTKDIIHAIQFLRENEIGNASFLRESDRAADRQIDEGIHRQIGTQDKIIGYLDDFMKCTPEIEPFVRNIVRNVFVTADLSDALSLAADLSCPEITFVTLDGDIVRGSCWISGGSTGKKFSLLNRQRKIDLLEKEIAHHQNELADIDDALTAGEQFRNTLLQKKREAEQRYRRTQDDITRRRFAVEQLQATMKNDRTRIEALREKIRTLKDKLESIIVRHDRVRDNFNASREGVHTLKAEIEELKKEHDDAENRYNSEYSSCHSIRTGIASARARKDGLEREKAMIEENLERLELLRKKKKEEEKECGHRIILLQKNSTLLKEKLRGTAETLHRAKKAMDDAQERFDGVLSRLEKTKSSLENCRDEKEHLLEEVHKTELRVRELGSEMNLENSRLAEKYGLSSENVSSTPPRCLKGRAPEEAMAHYRKKLDRLGPVNYLAQEEYTREKERQEFLKGQIEDLRNSRDDIEKVITKINRTARHQFLETFEQVKENFRVFFKTLFDGGDTDLFIEHDRDPLEGVIHIMATPRGKKLKYIQLLSGGEKALTAIALLFALFSTKPSPFCLLDEIDAPLDDTNITRFLTLLEQFKKTSQFIIITHNKKTMEIADYLYGITMEEPGVSSMISVKLEEHRRTGDVREKRGKEFDNRDAVITEHARI
jgi:chromosome segregation protein